MAEAEGGGCSPSTARSPGPAARRACDGAVDAQRRPVLRSSAGGSVRHPSGRGEVRLLDPHDVQDPSGEPAGTGAAEPAVSPAVQGSGGAGARAPPVVG